MGLWSHQTTALRGNKVGFQYEAAVPHKPLHQPPVRYSTSYQDPFAGYQQPGPVDNAILGSGNFDILKGGTFYDKNDYRSSGFRWAF